MKEGNKQRHARLAAAILSVGLLVSPADIRAVIAAGNTAGDGNGGAPDNGGGLDEIVVTAEKRQEGVNKVPLSIQAFTENTLRQAGVTSVTALPQVVPGLTYAESSGSTPIYTLRGVGFNTPNVSSTSPVGIYVDEVAYAYPYMSGGPLFDIDRVEVLKGPQGTLYGRNTTGGLVNFITAQPGKEFDAGIETEIGNYSTHNFDGYVSGPLSDTVTARIAARSENSEDGWQHSASRPGDTLGKINKQAVRGTLDWVATERFSANLMASYWRNRSDTTAAQAVGYTPQQPLFAVPGLAQAVHTNWANNMADWPSSATTGVPPLKSDSDFYSVAARLNYKLTNALSLTSLTSYNRVNRDDNNDLSGTPYLVFDDLSTGKIGSFSQELRLNGTAEALNYILGVYYSFDTITDDQVGYYTASSTNHLLRYLAQTDVDPTNSRYSAAQYAGGFATYRNELSENNRSDSIFGNVDYQLNSQFKLSGGLRFTDDLLKYGSCSADYNGNTLPVWNTAVEYLIGAKTGTNPNNTVSSNGCLTYNANYTATAAYQKAPLDEHNIGGRATATYTPDDALLFYGTFSRGFKSAVVPVLAANVETQLTPARQEEVTNFEVGGKLGFFQHTVQLNFAAFYDNYKDKQLFSDVLDPVFTALERIVNVPKSHIQGGEGDLEWKIAPAWHVNFGGSYTKSELTQFQGYDRFGVATNFAGSEFPYTPHWQGNGAITYDTPISSSFGFQITPNVSYQSASSATIGAEPGFGVDSRTLVNLTTNLYSLDHHWHVGAYAKNLLNRNYWTSVDVLTDTVFRLPGMPVTYGVTLGYNFR